MLRPATPLTILLFAAFALLLISVISTPIIKQIPLGSYGGVDFGVFGYCRGATCSPIEVGYSTASLFNVEDQESFDLPTAARATLSTILIVHPIAAFFTLIMAVLSAAAHLHAPSHSPRYLLGIFILSILTLVLALLSFLVDVLLFVPHMAWGSYIVLAATILIAASGIISCAMRRTLVSRKARKRRIAENAEMNGENYYNRQGTVPAGTTQSNAVTSGSAIDSLPAFATFELAKKETAGSSDERIPLTNTSPSGQSNNIPPGTGVSDRYAQGGISPTDQYGNAMPVPLPGSAYGASGSRDPSVDPSMNRQYSDNSMNSRGRGMPGPGGYRGGGYGPPRGGYAQNGRGNYGPPRGGYAPNGRGNYGPPRGGYGGGGPYRGGPNDMGGGMAGGAMMRGGRGAPPGYGRTPPPNEYNAEPGYGGDYRGPPPTGDYRGPPATGYTTYNPADDRSSLARAESPPPLPNTYTGPVGGPVGQAIEMDATTGSRSPSVTPAGFGQYGNIRDSDGDVAGMVGLQQQRLARHETVSSSQYSTDEYIPPRKAWQEDGRSSPLNPATRAAELPVETRSHARSNSDHYYEDVDQRFVEPAHVPPPVVAPPYVNRPSDNNYSLHPMGNLDGQRSYEDLQSGARSPAESDRSNFTSVSQRGINPRWNAPPPGRQQPMPRRPVNQSPPKPDILNSNPDFQLPGARGGRGGGRGGGMIPSSAYNGAL